MHSGAVCMLGKKLGIRHGLCNACAASSTRASHPAAAGVLPTWPRHFCMKYHCGIRRRQTDRLPPPILRSRGLRHRTTRSSCVFAAGDRGARRGLRGRRIGGTRRDGGVLHGPQALDENPYRAVARAYVTLGLLASRQFGRTNVYLNFENITNMRQSRFDPLLRLTPGAGGGRTVDEWAPLEGRTVNAGVLARP